MTVSISSDVQNAGEALIRLANGDAKTFEGALLATLNRWLGWPFRANSGTAIDVDGKRTPRFAIVVHTTTPQPSVQDDVEIPSDTLACVIDVCKKLTLEQLKVAYRKIGEAKSLRKSAPPQLSGVPHTTTTLGIIFAVETDLPLDKLAEELEHLNEKTESSHWPDMVAVLSKGTINYVVQFPGEGPSGDYLPPGPGAVSSFTPPMYIIIAIKPTGAYTLNKMCAFLLAHLAIFSPGANLPKWIDILEGTPKEALIYKGYQYNLNGQLVPVPRKFYNDRYVGPRPVHVDDKQGNRLATLQYLPWQDGGVVLLTGKLPLEGLLVFLGKQALKNAGVVKRGDRQLSYALPITEADFGQMLNRIQRQSNMVVRPDTTGFVVQKIADEGSTSPFISRLFMGILYLRDAAFPDPAKRHDFDKAYEFVMMTFMSTRKTAHDLKEIFSEHAKKVAHGDIARVQGPTIYIDENIDRELRKLAEEFLNSAVRIMKHGMQEVTKSLQVNISFLFKKTSTFQSGLTVMRGYDQKLAEYLFETRQWSELLVECRNAMEHTGSVLPKVGYSHRAAGVQAEEPRIMGQPISEFVDSIIDRMACFIEEVTAHSLQKHLPVGMTITELPQPERDPEKPERFRLTLVNGGQPTWSISYHQSRFDQT